ncbi:hypothetical protein RhiirC2_791467 [Rhizophagus irregularis]|uniref:Ion transport domain-containing protein n=1 Tax=Rhizophagus irregularis TaxID=588596 RepID=A0A2N1MJ60_9GLOM|nr:hypothetical protein RhiirC2_791467 [Rhizophagus irregularis]
MDEIFIKVDETYHDKVDSDVHNSEIIEKLHNGHNGKPITKIEISPKGKYLVTYSEGDKSLICWNVENVDGSQLKSEFSVNSDKRLNQICISDDKKFAYTYSCYIDIYRYDMMNNRQKIELDCDLIYDDSNPYDYCTFNLKDELILYCRGTIFIYSTQTKSNQWNCIRMYKKSGNFKFISISKYDKLYLYLNNSIYEWNLVTEKSIKIFGNDKEMRYMKSELVKISSDEKFICTRVIDKIIIYSIELEVSIASFDINNVIQLHMLIKHPVLYSLLRPLLFSLLSNIPRKGFLNSMMDHLPKKHFYLPNTIRTTSKYAFGILDGDVWKINLEKMELNISFLIKNSNELNNVNNSDEIVENWYFEINEDLYQNIVPGKDDRNKKYGDELMDLIDNTLSKPLNDKETFLMYGVGLLKFAIKENNLELIDDIYKKCINYFKEDLGNNNMSLSIITSTMSLLNEYYPEYILRYSLETTMIIDTPFYSTVHKNNNLHLSSFQYPQMVNITQTILWARYNIFMRKLHDRNIYTFMIYIVLNIIQFLIILPLSPIYFTTYYILLKYHLINNIYVSDMLSYFYLIPSYFVNVYYKIFPRSTITTPTIIFMNPYIKFVNYPQKYNWFLELIKPKSSPFVKTINRDIYKTWNGEALINFKWDTYGKYYYAMIWIGFMALLGCFTAAATIPQQYINEEIQNQLLIASIILGFIHLSFEVRQFSYNPIKWAHDFWNLFDVIAYVLPIYTSIRWLQTNETNLIPLLSFSCLFLDIKFLLFFRAIEYFGIYFAIIISVAKQIVSFLVVLLIIIISFAHAFYILLTPRSIFSFDELTNNNDPNNPWNIVSSYYQIFKNGTIDTHQFLIQQPNGNTNMFNDFRTSLFAMYLSLTGDSSALSNWSYTDNPSLAILIVLFSLLIVVYLMNLFIGLLNNAIEKDNDRVSYLMQKAEILAEIELFYLLPHQRRWNSWFPEVIYYYANVDMTRKKIKELIDDNEWDSNEFIELKQILIKKLNIKHNFNK